MLSRDPVWFGFLAGGFGDSTASLVSHPMDVTKVRLQLQGELSAKRQPVGFRNIFRTLMLIYKHEGVMRGIYSGLSAAVARQLVFSSLRHGTFKWTMSLYADRATLTGIDAIMPLPLQVVVGAAIGAFAAAIANPFDVVLIRMQADGHWPPEHRRRYHNVFDGIFRICNEEGVSSLYRGCNATVTRGILVTCSQLPSYHRAKELLLQYGLFSDPGDSRLHFISSIISAGTASIMTSPVDVIKTRLMNMKRTEISPQYSGMTDCCVQIWRTEGPRGFFKGLGATFARLAPHTICMWLAQEQYLNLFREFF